MTEHLVRSHLGGYYLSVANPRHIEEYCEQCGDSDEIIASWDENDEKEMVEVLLSACYQESNLPDHTDNEEEVFYKWLDDNDIQENIRSEVTELFSYLKYFINHLSDEERIPAKISGQVRGSIVDREQEWQILVTDYENKNLIESHQKVMKKRK